MLLGSHMPRGVLYLVATCQRVGKPALGIDTRNRQRQRLERDLHFSVVHPIRVHRDYQCFASNLPFVRLPHHPPTSCVDEPGADVSTALHEARCYPLTMCSEFAADIWQTQSSNRHILVS
ncbi:hypothetical protein J7T55_015777 [Diaporthe amygdali]|uniref:uncharacterized protein n=1 Tax=Phomopsis amygdali TaxID=1214568 RepID=UPI0022FE7DDD|nr:uncharacterized protein J7T55_015777 [Diaporthe amygdali]KAJ0107311.1 hypothetical protein J7T55_015777 [Diaporthe amygdali]